jgi:hypothetical protein
MNIRNKLWDIIPILSAVKLSDFVPEILKKFMKTCGLKSIILLENTNELSHRVVFNSKDYFVILTLINDTSYQKTQSFNQMRPSSLFIALEVRNKIAFHTI